jgi:hypothetical protein
MMSYVRSHCYNWLCSEWGVCQGSRTVEHWAYYTTQHNQMVAIWWRKWNWPGVSMWILWHLIQWASGYCILMWVSTCLVWISEWVSHTPVLCEIYTMTKDTVEHEACNTSRWHILLYDSHSITQTSKDTDNLKWKLASVFTLFSMMAGSATLPSIHTRCEQGSTNPSSRTEVDITYLLTTFREATQNVFIQIADVPQI